MVCIVLNNDQRGFHHTVSASTLSYSSCDPKNRIIRTHQRNQSIIVRLDVKDHPATLQYADLWMGSLHILWRFPLAALRNGPPGLILSPSGLNPLFLGKIGNLAGALWCRGPE